MKNLSWVSVLVIALAASLGALYIDRNFFRDQKVAYQTIGERQAEVLGKYFSDTLPSFGANINFVSAAQRVRGSVVYIRSTYSKMPELMRKDHENVPEMEDFFKDRSPMNQSSGSGVILTDDGYIVTNNHVIDEAGKVEVILENKQSFEAQVIGTDPTTDLALLKINASGLPFLKYGDSDKLQVGEWVLAIGNPFDLTSTVTAGIISGKGRNINILREKSNLAIESFIQTDAAVNPGNSGGALVNLKGELVGINTAIASPTGSYSGYSFAVPSDLTQKVIDDLLKFGTVQRALLGVSIIDIDSRLANELNLKSIEGVYVREVNPGSAAALAKIASGDVILAINGKTVGTVPELQEVVGRFRPGDKVKLEILRKGERQEITVILKNQSGNTQLAKRENNKSIEIKELGGEFASVSTQRKGELGIQSGVEVVRISDRRLEKIGLIEGFVIQKMDKQPVRNPQDVERIYSKAKGGILVEGFNPDGEREFFALVK